MSKTIISLAVLSLMFLAASALLEQTPNQFNAMTAKFTEATNILAVANLNASLAETAINELMESLFISNWLILPSRGPAATPTLQLYQMFTDMLSVALNTLHFQKTRASDPNIRAMALRTEDWLFVFQEVFTTIAGLTIDCNPSVFGSVQCHMLLQEDESGTTIDPVLGGPTDPTNSTFMREVASPFPWWTRLDMFLEPAEVAFQFNQPIPDGSCTFILREVRGVKIVVRVAILPVTAEPWFSRAFIVGVLPVFIFEFVPAEFLKTISICTVDVPNAGVAGSHSALMAQEVSTEVVIDRQLQHFWKFLSTCPV